MSTPYFLVHSVEMNDGVALVDGRLGEVEIAIGHVFSRSFPHETAWRQKESGLPCALVVRGIEAYQLQLGELSPGMTARLSMHGSHLSALKSAAVIE